MTSAIERLKHQNMISLVKNNNLVELKEGNNSQMAWPYLLAYR